MYLREAQSPTASTQCLLTTLNLFPSQDWGRSALGVGLEETFREHLRCGQKASLGVRAGALFLLCHALPVWPLAHHSSRLGLSFLTCQW